MATSCVKEDFAGLESPCCWLLFCYDEGVIHINITFISGRRSYVTSMEPESVSEEDSNEYDENEVTRKHC